MFDSRRVREYRKAPEMHSHVFTYSGVTYEVRFHRMDGQWFATLYVSGSEDGRPLLPIPDEVTAGVSDQSIRSGFIGVAEWLVKTRGSKSLPKALVPQRWSRRIVGDYPS